MCGIEGRRDKRWSVKTEENWRERKYTRVRWPKENRSGVLDWGNSDPRLQVPTKFDRWIIMFDFAE